MRHTASGTVAGDTRRFGRQENVQSFLAVTNNMALDTIHGDVFGVIELTAD